MENKIQDQFIQIHSVANHLSIDKDKRVEETMMTNVLIIKAISNKKAGIKKRVSGLVASRIAEMRQVV